jgi:hypothetical protein
MSSPDRRRYILTAENKPWVASLVLALDAGVTVTFAPPGRSLPQNDYLHSLWDQLARALPTFRGIPMDAEAWKALTIVSHAIATRDDEDGQPIRLVPDLEGEGMVQLRESSARMSKARAASLTDYVLKVGAENGVRFLSDARETDGPEVKLPRRRPHG